MTKKLIILILIIFSGLLYLAITLLNSNQNTNIPKTQESQFRVIDGDTFSYQNQTIRLLCINTPEKGKDGYQEASDFLESKLINAKNITLEGNKTDIYGRSLKWVYADGVLVNKEILDSGLGVLYEFSEEDCSLLQ